MKLVLVAAFLACAAAPAVAEDFPGDALANFYMTEMSYPKGWELTYEGKASGTEVFIMDRDLDTHPQTSFLQPIDQLRRLMCNDATAKQFMAGRVLRIDSRDLKGGKTSRVKGPELSSC
jgi:hypothetical protein